MSDSSRFSLALETPDARLVANSNLADSAPLRHGFGNGQLSEGGILLLLWGSPWPAHCGCSLRQQGLLTELARIAHVDLVVMNDKPLTCAQRQYCLRYARSLREVRRADATPVERAAAFLLALRKRVPIHSAIALRSCRDVAVLDVVRRHPGIIYCSTSHWGELVSTVRPDATWVLDQHNADVEFWKLYARETKSLLMKSVAQVNTWLASKHFPSLYLKPSRVVCVSDEDLKWTKSLAHDCRALVIENGVDCAYFAPNRSGARHGNPALLFTGTDAGRNIKALAQFMKNVLPRIRERIPSVEFVIAGRFREAAQATLRSLGRVSFSGEVSDIRPWYDESDVLVAPFWESYGSKLKVSQALSMGICVVATEAAVRGFPVVNGESVLIAENEVDFAEKALAALSSAELRDRMGSLARQVALQCLDWNVLGRKLARCLDALWPPTGNKSVV